MDILPNNMLNLMLGSLLILAFSATTSFAQGVKGGYHSPPYESLVSFPAKESGTCYKRVLYTQALAANISNGHVQIVPGTQTSQQGVKSGGSSVVTIIDCCDGLIRNRDTGECETHCDEGCFGGECTGPNICTCDTGYTVIGGICTPVCTRPCPFNSVCHLPDECKCNVGYEKENGECKPVCPDGCINGDCIAPSLCRCKPGFSFNEKYNECFPVCEGGCLNGECAGPGFCRCYPGYQNSIGDLESCQPQCPKGCYGGECLAPGLCQCEHGYILDSTNTCVPVCESDCGNGRCVGPNQCSCYAGSHLDNLTKKCISDAIEHYGQKVTVIDQQSGNYGNVGGAYGKGGIYNQHSGTYGQQSGTYDQQSTLGVENLQAGSCENQCINGVCSKNECICNRGYMLDQLDITGTRCVPICYGGCRNGICSAPNTCLCNPGFEKDRSVKGRQICIPVSH